MTQTADIATELSRFVDDLRARGFVRSARVESAFRSVRRDLFVPAIEWRLAYQDESIVTKAAAGVALSSSSQPTLMAAVLEQLDLHPGHRVLEIGAGTGYNAALMAHIVGPEGRVFTIDIDPDIVSNAHDHLANAGCSTVSTRCGDGADGVAECGPYDRIVAAVATSDITPEWRSQLRDDGLLVVPLSIRGPQKSIAFRRDGGHLRSTEVVDCHYIPLRGECSGWLQDTTCGLEGRVTVTTEKQAALSGVALDATLSEPAIVQRTGVIVSLSDVHSSLSLWLALQHPRFCTLAISQGPSCSSILDRIFGPTARFRPLRTIGALADDGLCLLAAGAPVQADAFEIVVRAFGPVHALVESLVTEIQAWDARGRPSTRTLHVAAYPAGAPYPIGPRQFSIAKRWHSYVFDWRN